MKKPDQPLTHSAIDISNEPVHWDLSGSKSYGEYLQLDKLLSAQQPGTFEHDEMLFIIIHQSSELWIKLCIHELTAAIKYIQRDNLGPVDKCLNRMARIQAQLTQSWDVLATMTPMDYPNMIEVYRNNPDTYALLQRVLTAPCLYDEVIALLSRRGFGIPAEYLDRDWSQPYQANKQVAAAWLAVYHNREEHWDLYELAEKLVDLDHQFQLWRFSHMKTVERIIGYKRGTGGTSGVNYLNKALELRFFPELWSVRTSM